MGMGDGADWEVQDQGSSFRAFPATGQRAPGQCPALFSSSGHCLRLGTDATGSLLKCLWCGCEWTPSKQVQSSSAALPGSAKDGSMHPQQELLALQREEKRSRCGKDGGGMKAGVGGRARLSQALGRVQGVGLILSGARSLSPAPSPPLQALKPWPWALTQWDQRQAPEAPPWPMQGPAGGCLCLLPLPGTCCPPLLPSLTAIWLAPHHPSGQEVGSPPLQPLPDSLGNTDPAGASIHSQGSTYQVNTVTGYLPFSFSAGTE